MIVIKDIRLDIFRPEEMMNLKVQAYLLDKFLKEVNSNPSSITFIELGIHRGRESEIIKRNVEFYNEDKDLNRIEIKGQIRINTKDQPDCLLHEFVHLIQLPKGVFSGERKKIELVLEVPCVAVCVSILHRYVYNRELNPEDIYLNFKNFDNPKTLKLYNAVWGFVNDYFNDLNSLTKVGDLKKFMETMMYLQVVLAKDYLKVKVREDLVNIIKEGLNKVMYDINMIKYYPEVKDLVNFRYIMYKCGEKYLDYIEPIYLTEKEEEKVTNQIFSEGE